MATKARKTEKSKRTKRSFGAGLEWVINNLSAAQLADLDGRYPNEIEIVGFLMACVDNGIDVKISHDDYSNTYAATAIGAWDGFPSAGYGTNGRSGRDTFDALVILWYKIAIVAEGDLSSIPTDGEMDKMRG